jgi:rubrerythrin
MMGGGPMMGGGSMPMMDGGSMMKNGPMMQDGPMGGGPMMGDGSMGQMGSRMGVQPGAAPLSSDAKAALLRALDEEYRAEALYASIGATKIGARAPFLSITRSERRHAWILESLALAHGVELPTNAWMTAKQPEVASAAAGCRAAVESEKKTIALYDELLKTDVPNDLHRAFEHLRAASVERHLPAFEACR